MLLIQRGHCTRGKWAAGKLIKFNKGEGKVLCQGWNHLIKHCRLEADQVESSSVFDNKLNVSQQCAPGLFQRCPVVEQEATGSSQNKIIKKIPLAIRKICYCEGSQTVEKGPRKAVRSPSLDIRHPKPAWTRPRATGFIWSCSQQGYGLGSLQRSLPTQQILCFCGCYGQTQIGVCTTIRRWGMSYLPRGEQLLSKEALS